MMRATDHLLTVKENIMWFTSGMLGVLAVDRWLIPGSGVSVVIPFAIVVGANIGSYLRARNDVGEPYDERHDRIFGEAMTWGFVAMIAVLGADILAGLSVTSEELFLAGGTVAVVVAGLMEIAQRNVQESLPVLGS